MEVELSASTQEISRLRAEVAMLESELSAHELRPGASDAAPVAEMTALKSEVQQKEQELSDMRLQLQSVLHSSTEVCPACSDIHLFLRLQFAYHTCPKGSCCAHSESRLAAVGTKTFFVL